MCTASWWMDGTRRGVLFNRDEKRQRAFGLPPRIFPGEGGGTEVLGPLDTEAGGTWIGVNAHGVIAGVLNLYPHYQGTIPGRRSRGSMLLDLLASSSSARGLVLSVERMNSLRLHRGFLLLAMDREDPPSVVAWDGRELRRVQVDDGIRMLTTSSWNPERCLQVRTAVFARAGKDAESLRRAHGTFDPANPGASPIMAREDAATDSVTEVELGEGEARLTYREVRGFPPVAGAAVVKRLPLLCDGKCP